MIILAGTLASEGIAAVMPPIMVVSVVTVIISSITMIVVVVPTMVIAVDITTQWVFGA
jgi:hypothetical protein